MNSRQFERWLKAQGIKIIERKSGGGHRDLHNPTSGRWSQIPTHGGRKQLGTGLMEKIRKDLGLK
jgi:mRNA interferase HicA